MAEGSCEPPEHVLEEIMTKFVYHAPSENLMWVLQQLGASAPSLLGVLQQQALRLSCAPALKETRLVPASYQGAIGWRCD